MKVKQVGNLYPDTEKFKNRTMGRVYDAGGISPTINCCGGGDREPKIIIEGNYSPSNHGASKIVSKEGIAPTVMENHGTVTAILMPKIIDSLKIKEATKQGYDIAADGDSVNLSNPNSSTRRGRVGKQIANTLDTGCLQGVVTQYRIRKLTPRECFRLMGVDEINIDKIQAAGISNSQQFKLAGNSIVVDNLFHIFRTLFSDTNQKKTHN